jgi:hypothetical protein
MQDGRGRYGEVMMTRDATQPYMNLNDLF